MKRRQLLKSFAAMPAVVALTAQEQPVPPKPTPRAVEETPKIEATVPDQVADTVPAFFSADQFAALHRLAGLLMPAINGTPGATEARAAEFLDFLIGQSPADRQKLYRDGLDVLNAKRFRDASPRDADAILAPLREPWTYSGPSDPFARFLLQAKEDVMTATVNSREWIAVVSKRSRGAGGLATYWYPIA